MTERFTRTQRVTDERTQIGTPEDVARAVYSRFTSLNAREGGDVTYEAIGTDQFDGSLQLREGEDRAQV